MLTADTASFVIAAVVTALVTVVVLAAFVWAAIQDGRDDARVRQRRRGTS